MAYDASKEKQVEYGMIKKNSRGEYIKVTRIIPSDRKMESIDIRLYYTDDSDTIRPTQKGVRISSEQIGEVVRAILRAMTPEEKLDITNELSQDSVEYDSEAVFEDADTNYDF